MVHGRRRTGAFAVAGVLLGLMVLGVVLVGRVIRAADERPDVAAVGRSAAVEAADQQATGLIEQRLATLTALAVDMTPVATAVQDACTAPPGGEIPSTYRAVTCTRTVTRYFAFGGTVPPRRTGWDQALVGSGWAGSPPMSDEWRAPLTYADGAGMTLDVGWEQGPQPPTMWDRNPPGPVTYYRTHQPVDAGALAATVYRDSPYMAIAVLQKTYYDRSVSIGAGRLQVVATSTALPEAAAACMDSITSRTCRATSADARCGRDSARASCRSSRPIPRPPST